MCCMYVLCVCCVCVCYVGIGMQSQYYERKCCDKCVSMTEIRRQIMLRKCQIIMGVILGYIMSEWFMDIFNMLGEYSNKDISLIIQFLWFFFVWIVTIYIGHIFLRFIEVSNVTGAGNTTHNQTNHTQQNINDNTIHDNHGLLHCFFFFVYFVCVCVCVCIFWFFWFFFKYDVFRFF